MKKLIVALALIVIFLTSCEGYRTVSYRPNYHYRPVPTVQYIYPRPQYYYYPQQYHYQPHYSVPRYGGGHRR